MLSGSATTAHFVLFALSPVLSRMYDDGDFATFAFYQSSVSILSLMLTLQFEQAITIPSCSKEADTVRRLAIRAAVFLAMLLTAPVLWLSLTGRLNGFWLAPLVIALIPFCSLAEAYARTCRVEAVRGAAFRRMSISRVLLSIGTGAGQIVSALVGLKNVGLVLGDGIGRWISAIPFLLGRKSSCGQAPLSLESSEGRSRSMPELAREFLKFPLLLTPAAVLALLVNVSPALLLPVLFDEKFAGQFALANRSILLPLMVISQAVTHVYVCEASKMIREKNPGLPRLIRTTAWQLAGVGSVLAISAAVLGPLLFTTIFGAKWETAGRIVPFLALSGFAQFVGGPLNQVLVLTREEGRKFLMNLTGVVSIAAVFWFCSKSHLTGIQATACYAGTVFCVQSLYVYQSFRVAHEQIRRWESESVPDVPATRLAA